MLSVPTVIAIVGGIAFLVGLFGGGIEIKEIKFPKIPDWLRIVSVIVGVAFIVVAALLPYPPVPPETTLPPPVTPDTPTATPITPTNTPVPSSTGTSTLESTTSIPADTFTPTSTNTPTTNTPTPTLTATPTATDTATSTAAAIHRPAPEPGKIAYPVCKGNRKYICIAHLEGDGVRSVLFEEDASEPAISPDGSKIAFRSWNASTLGLMVMNIDGTSPQRVSRNLEDACPYWALGESLVFHSQKEGSTPRLYTAGTWEGANGLNNVKDMRWGADPVYGQYPAWVPDERIVYRYFDQSGNSHGLYVMKSDGSNPEPITYDAGDTMPSVSPLGYRIAFMSKDNSHWEVYAVNIDGSALRQLTDSDGYNSGLPTWSPDGRYIAFVSDRDNQWAIWIMKSDGSGERKLFDLDGTLTWGERISWGP